MGKMMKILPFVLIPINMQFPAANNLYTVLISGFQLLIVSSLRFGPIKRKFFKDEDQKLDKSVETELIFKEEKIK